MKKWLIGTLVVTALFFLWENKIFEATNKSILPSAPHKQVQGDAAKDANASEKTTSNLADKQAVDPGVNNPVASAASKTGSPLKAKNADGTNWSEQFPNAQVLEQKEYPVKNEKDLVKRYTVLKTGLDAPYVRVEQIFQTDAATGKQKMIHQSEAVANHLMVGLKEGVSPNRLEAIAHQYSAKIINKTLDEKVVLLELADHSVDTLDKMIGEFSSYKNTVTYAEPDYLVHSTVTPNDAYYSYNSSTFSKIQCPVIWDMEKGKKTVLVAVIGTAMDINHEDLAANIWTNPGEIPGNRIDDDNNGYTDDIHGWDFTGRFPGDANVNEDPGTESWDGYGHETECAGLVGAVGNNHTGIAGVCWTTQIVPIRCNSYSSNSIFNYIKGIKYATKLNVRIMSNSWGFCASWGTIPQSLKDSILEANTKGILFVAAAGNGAIDNDDSDPHYPASYDCPNIISVGASDQNDNVADFSNLGSNSVDLFAPGTNLTSTYPKNCYTIELNGTSFSTPLVAGACALLASHYPSMTGAQIKQRILDSVDKSAAFNGKCVSGGRLNVWKAFSMGDTWEPADNFSATATQLLSPIYEEKSHGPHFFKTGDGVDWFKMDVVAGKRYFVRFDSTGTFHTSAYWNSTSTNCGSGDPFPGIPFTYQLAPTQNGTYYFKADNPFPVNQDYYVYYWEQQPYPPNFLAIRQSDGIHLSWSDIYSDEAGFGIERKIGNGDWSAIHETAANVTSWVDSQATAEDIYSYRICMRRDGTQVEWGETMEVDQWDPADNTWASATLIDSITGTDISHGTHTLYGSDQEDWFVFNLEAGTSYEFRSSGSGDTIGEIYADPQGGCIASDDNSGGAGMFKLSYQPTQSRLYYLKVKRNGTTTTSYTLIYRATAIYPPQNVFAMIDSEGVYVGWEDYIINKEGFIVERATGSQDWVTVQQLPADNYGWFDEQADLTQYNRYRVRSYKGDMFSPWIEAACVDNWDPYDDLSDRATSLKPPQLDEKSHGPHSIFESDQTDWFKLDLTVGEVYGFKLGTIVPISVRIYQNPQDEPVKDWSMDSTSDCRFVPKVTGRHYVKVGRQSDSGYYTLRYRIVPDADNDGLGNLEELSHGTDPLNPDTDGDGLKDGAEVACGTEPLNPDTDNDGVKDGAEVAQGASPTQFNTWYRVTVLPDNMTANALNNNGTVVGTLRSGFAASRAVLIKAPYQAQDIKDLGSLGGPLESFKGVLNVACDVNDSDEVVGWNQDRYGIVQRAFLYRNDKLQDISSYIGSGYGTFFYPTAINNNGEVAFYSDRMTTKWTKFGDKRITHNYYSFLLKFKESQIMVLGNPGQNIKAVGINNSNQDHLSQVFGNGQCFSFIYEDEAGFADLTAQHGLLQIDAMNDVGEIVGWKQAGQMCLVDEEAGTSTDIGPFDQNMIASKINNSGQIVGSGKSEKYNNAVHGWVYDPVEGLSDLTDKIHPDDRSLLTGFSLESANDINDEGVIVGTAKGSKGSIKGVILMPAVKKE